MMFPELLDFERFLRRKYPHTSTPIHYLSDLRLFFACIEKDPAEVGVADLDDFIEHSQGQGHAMSTINRRLASLSAFYRFLQLMQEDPLANPVRKKRHFIRCGKPLPRDVPDADVARLFAVIDDPRDRAMFLLMLRCGLRVGEVRGLSLMDLYLEPGRHGLPRLWIAGKGGAERVAYLSTETLIAVERWLAVRPPSEDEAVFLNRFGRRLTVTGIQDRLAGYCRRADLWVTCHQLRHTFGRHLTEARLPVTSIQVLLGHKRLRSTQVYLHISDPHIQEQYLEAMQEVMQRLPLSAGGAA